MTYKLGLVQTADVNGPNVLLPVTIGVLWEYAMTSTINQHKWTLDKIVYKKEDITTTAKQLAECDMVAFSTYVWNHSYHFELAQQIKHHNSSCFIVFGGPDVYANFPNFWKDRKGCVDLAVIGEGETSFSLILEQWPNITLTDIPGAWSPIYFSGEAKRFTELDSVPSPHLNGFFDDIVKQEQSNQMIVQTTIQTNRGCPYRCTFCEEGREYKTKIFLYNTDRVKREITWCGQNQIGFISIADDNWGIMPRDIELMEHLCQTKQIYGFPESADATFAKNAPERVLALAEVDKKYNTNLIRGITAAVQSNNPQTLKAIKRFNLPQSQKDDFLIRLNQLGTPIYAELIWPLPFETLDTFTKGIDEMIETDLYNWIAVYPLMMARSADLYYDFHQSYSWPDKKNKLSKIGFQNWNNNPIGSNWAGMPDVIQGHVFSSWVSVFYFFGYAKILLTHLKTQYGLPISWFVNEWTEFLHQHPQGAIADFNRRLEIYWEEWLTSDNSTPLNKLSENDTTHWIPCIHLAMCLQENYNEFQDLLREFLIYKSFNNIGQILEDNSHGVVLYQKSYPYKTNASANVSLSHTQPEFKNLYEFCRYYFYWNRKRGLSVTKVQ